MSACPVCERRKGKRACPARAADICSHCCGTKRLVEIDCPPDCVYLEGGHAPAWDGRETDRRLDARRVAPHLSGLEEDQARLFLVALVGLAQLRRRRELDDRLLLQALTVMRKTAETRSRGILYEHQADDVRAQALARDIEELFGTPDAEGRREPPTDRDRLAALHALEAAAAAAVAEGAGPTAFLDTAVRVAGQLRPAERETSRPRIIEP